MITTILAALIALTACGNAPKEQGAEDDARSQARLVPDATIQAQIDTTVRAYGQVKDDDPHGVARVFREVHTLLKASGNDKVHLVRQLLYYQSRATDVAESMLPLFIIRDADVNKGTLVTAVLPLLASDDAKIREAAIRLARYVEDGATRDPDYSYYRSYIDGCKIESREPESALVERMYTVAPGVALLLFARAFASESPDLVTSTLWAEHVVADAVWKQQHRAFEKAAADARPAAIEQLDLLSKRKEWWARLYVAEVLRQHKELRTPELIARLKKDEHPLVRKLIAERDQMRPPPLNRPSAK